MLNFVKFGEGTPHIWLHGFLRCYKDLLQLAESLPGCHYLPDIRNHGDSFHTSECSLESLVNDVITLLDAQNISKANFIGFSMGGKIAMALALTFPDRVDKLCIIDIGPIMNDPFTSESHKFVLYMINVLEKLVITNKTIHEIEGMLKSEFEDSFTNSALITNLKGSDNNYTWKYNFDGLLNVFDAILRWGAYETAFRGPTLAILGAKSMTVVNHPIILEKATTINELFSRYFPRVKIEILECGHNVHLEKPAETLNALVNFL